MKYFTLVTLLLLLVLPANKPEASASSGAPGKNPNEISASLQSGLDLLYNLNLPAAHAISDSLIVNHPGEPVGYLLKGLICFYEHACGLPRAGLEKEIIAYNQKTVTLALAGGLNSRKRSDLLFYMGAAYSTLALFYGSENNWVKALPYARRAKKLHTEVIRADSTYYDAYLVPGLYNYYGDSLPKLLDLVSGLVGFKGDARRGLAQLEMAYSNGTLSKVEAATFLGTFFAEQGNYEKALAIYQQLADRYPDNPYFSIYKARTRFLLAEYAEAKTELELALRACRQEHRQARSLVRYYLGRCAMLRNDFSAAQTSLEQVIALGKNSERIELHDGWLTGDAYFYLAECEEFLGKPDSAKYYYQLAAQAKFASKGVVNGSKNRIQTPRSGMELAVVRRSNRLLWQPDEKKLAAYSAFRDSVLHVDPANPFLHLIDYNLGLANFRLHRYAPAIEWLNRAVQGSSTRNQKTWIELSAHTYLAACFLQLAESGKAEGHLRKALEGTGKGKDARLSFLARKLKGYLPHDKPNP